VSKKYKQKSFFSYKEIIIFVVFFIILFIIFNPQNTAKKFVEANSTNKVEVEFLLNELKKNPDDEKTIEKLAKVYFKRGEFDKALKYADMLPQDKKTTLLKIDILTSYYFQKKDPEIIKKLKKNLIFLLALDKNYEYTDFVLKKAREFSLTDVLLFALYKLSYQEKYFDQLLDVLMWKKNFKEAKILMLLSQNRNFSQKTYRKIISYALYMKDYDIAKKYLPKLIEDENYKFLTDVYLALGEPKKAFKIIQKYSHDPNELLKYALWTESYDKALYYMEQTPQRYSKKAYELAKFTHNTYYVKKILEHYIATGDYDKISELTQLFFNTNSVDEGIKYYESMYEKTNNPIFLKELFQLYYITGNAEGMAKTAIKMGDAITPSIALKVTSILLAKKEFDKAYELLMKAKNNLDNDEHVNKLEFYRTLYNISKLTNHLDTANEMLSHLNNAYEVIYMAQRYQRKNPKKALEIMLQNKEYLKNPAVMLNFMALAYKLKRYDLIIKYAQETKDKKLLQNPTFWHYYASALIKTKGYDYAKKRLKESLKYTKNHDYFYWFLINHKDKEIRKYLPQIKNDKILFSAYQMLGEKQKAMLIAKKLLKKEPYNLDLLISYYYLNPTSKLRFKIYKLLKRQAKHRLKDENFFDKYFSFALYYETPAKIKKLLKYAKAHFKDYKKYYLEYYSFYGMYDKIAQMEKQ